VEDIDTWTTLISCVFLTEKIVHVWTGYAHDVFSLNLTRDFGK
jgi:hypothetical protein